MSINLDNIEQIEIGKLQVLGSSGELCCLASDGEHGQRVHLLTEQEVRMVYQDLERWLDGRD